MVSNGSGFVGYKPSDTLKYYDDCANISARILNHENWVFKDILYKLGTHWASPEAVEYSEKLCVKMNGIIKDSAYNLSQILEYIKSAGNKWSETTKNGDVVFTSKNSIINQSVIEVHSQAVNNVNGIVGADPQYFVRDFRREIDFESEYKTLNGQFQKAAANIGFLGANQAASLSNSVNEICKKVNNEINIFIEEITKEAIAVADKHRDTADKIYSEFSNIEGE